ncbi:hypothetical protein LCGC14_2946140 [marine sediment metagenome]|uniref:Uncharacterized protein n=1 Tax=marine sediment metagenome TaxID=412755 RepID=A0A0F8XGD2_9ZZZZ
MKASEVSPGDTIYVRSSFFFSHGCGDFVGGKAIIESIRDGMSAGKPTPFVIFVGVNTLYNLDLLMEEQEKLREQFGDSWAHAEPDMRFEFNRY